MKHKNLLLTNAILFIAMCSMSQETGNFTDSRDGKIYKTVKIGTQTWMAENLAYKTNKGCVIYDNNQDNLATNAYLYNWETAQKVCPDGWHLPTDKEWQTMELYLGLQNEELEYSRKRGEGIGLKLKSTTGWYNNGNGNNTIGFNALPSGACLFYDNSFQFLNESAYFWTSSPMDVDAWARVLKYDGSYIDRSLFSKNNSLSVRCIKD